MSDIQYGLPDEFQDPLFDYEPRTYADPLEEALAEETVAAIQCRPYAQVSPDQSVYDALQVLAGLKVASLLVVEQRRLVGIFTVRDVTVRVSPRHAEIKRLRVREVMTPNPVVVHDTDPAGAALTAIAVAGHRHVPVVGIHEEIVGVISPRRMLDFIRSRWNG